MHNAFITDERPAAALQDRRRGDLHQRIRRPIPLPRRRVLQANGAFGVVCAWQALPAGFIFAVDAGCAIQSAS